MNSNPEFGRYFMGHSIYRKAGGAVYGWRQMMRFFRNLFELVVTGNGILISL
jgi:hypothetical protein